MAKHQTLLDTIGLIYEASLDRDLWPRVIGAICELTDSSVGVLTLSDRTGYCLNVLHGINPALVFRANQYFSTNPYMRCRERWPSGSAVLGRQLVTGQKIEESAFFQEILRPNGAHHLCGIVFHNEPDLFGELSVYRDRNQEPHGEAELDLANAVAPHIQRAARIAGLLQGHSPLSSNFDALAERFRFGLMLLGPVAKVIYANRRAEHLLRNGLLTIKQGQAMVTDLASSVRLTDLVECARASRHPSAGILERVDGGVIRLVAIPLPERRGDYSTLVPTADVALVLLETVGEINIPLDLVGSLYGLTAAELRLAEALMAGTRPADFAKRVGLSRNTVKTQLRTLYAKVGASGHANLVRHFSYLTLLRI